MNLIKGFTRRETLALTGTTSNRLQYLERASLVVPKRVEVGAKKSTVLYTWEQILEIRAIKNLRQEVSLQTIRSIIQFLDEGGFDDTLRDKKLVVIGEEVFWIKLDWSDLPAAMKVAGRQNAGVGQFVIVAFPSLSEIVDEIWKAAKESTVIDFQSFRERAKAKPVKVA